MPVQIKDVARHAQVSVATVSRVLANKPYINEETRQRVLLSVKELGYQPSRVARSLRVKTSQIIGLIISDIQNPFFTSLVRAVEDTASANQLAIFLCNSDEDPQKEALYVDLMISEHVAGVIITPTCEVGCSVKRLVDAGIPVVTVDRRVLDLELDTVVLDNISAASDLVTYLLNLGHRRIGAILGSSEITTGHERFHGYEMAISSFGMQIDPNLVRAGLPKEDLGYQFTSELLELQEPPTALFVGNNLLTIGALKSIRDHKLSIPQDVSVVSFDDLDWMLLLNPPLTVASQPTYKMGQSAANLILSRILNPRKPPETIVFGTELKIRESCRPA
jgi:LacI family transcriptional regulator